ncbi:hypothetical protein HOD29_02485 [archaeon]|mgnify:FL=1|jgi:hypothetical protein|nr:hypothetical protein [archaeon]
MKTIVRILIWAIIALLVIIGIQHAFQLFIETAQLMCAASIRGTLEEYQQLPLDYVSKPFGIIASYYLVTIIIIFTVPLRLFRKAEWFNYGSLFWVEWIAILTALFVILGGVITLFLGINWHLLLLGMFWGLILTTLLVVLASVGLIAALIFTEMFNIKIGEKK